VIKIVLCRVWLMVRLWKLIMERMKYDDDLLTGPSDLQVQSRQLWSCTSDSAPSEARKRGSGGGSPRKYDGLLTVFLGHLGKR
jgi:hypothetical protein